MASVDGSKSFLAGSDEVIQHTCGPCKDDGETKEGKYLCGICKIYLCYDCKNDHNTFKATKNHEVVSVGTSSAATDETFAILCGCDQKRGVEVYCEKHVDVICPSCEKIKHRNCETCAIKDKVSKDSNKTLTEVMEYAKVLKTKIESCKQDAEANLTKLQTTTEECKKAITAFRRTVDKILDNFETDLLESLRKIESQQLQLLKKQLATLNASLQALDTDIAIADNSRKTNKDVTVFSANVKISKNLAEYDDLLEDIRNVMQQPNLDFQKNKKLIDMLKDIEGLGKIELYATCSTKQANVITEMKVKSRKEVNIKLPEDSRDPDIHGCTFLSDGRVLLCDYNNRNMKLLDSAMSIKKSLKLQDYPLKVAVIGENEAVITFDDCKYLQYVYTEPDLKIGNRVALPDRCHGLFIVNDEVYTTFHRASGHDEVWKIDRAGNVTSKLVLTQRSSEYYDSLCLCLEGHEPRDMFSETITF